MAKHAKKKIVSFFFTNFTKSKCYKDEGREEESNASRKKIDDDQAGPISRQGNLERGRLPPFTPAVPRSVSLARALPAPSRRRPPRAAVNRNGAAFSFRSLPPPIHRLARSLLPYFSQLLRASPCSSSSSRAHKAGGCVGLGASLARGGVIFLRACSLPWRGVRRWWCRRRRTTTSTPSWFAG